MLERFEGTRGGELLLAALADTKMLAGSLDLAKELASQGELIAFAAGSTLIEQADHTNDVFFIISGSCSVIINGRQVAKRGPGDHVGEMAAIQPTQPRSATVAASEDVVALKVSEEAFTSLANKHPQIYRTVAQELSRRLMQRNSTIGSFRAKTKLFVISSVEALPVARIVEDAFEHDDFDTQLWTAGCFKAAHYTLEDLELAVDASDFAVAIAHADDITKGRKDQEWPTPRDNVIFELGLFMGRLGRSRAILMEPRGSDVKLPSDLAGITTIGYKFELGGENARLMGPACNKLRNHILALGPNNG